MSSNSPPQTAQGEPTRMFAARVFAAMGDPNRLLLVRKLADGEPRSIAGLASDFPLSRQAITKHLRVLEQAGIVCSDRVGRESQYSYVPEPINDARSYLDVVNEQWDDALSRLQAFVEGPEARGRGSGPDS